MTPTGYAPQHPTIGQPQQANRNAIAGLMGHQGSRSQFGFGGGSNPFVSPMPQAPMGPPGGGQMPVPPSLNFTPGQGTSSPAMTNWRPPQYGSQNAAPGFAPPIQPITTPSTGTMQPMPTRQPMPVSPSQNPYLRPVTR